MDGPELGSRALFGFKRSHMRTRVLHWSRTGMDNDKNRKYSVREEQLRPEG